MVMATSLSTSGAMVWVTSGSSAQKTMPSQLKSILAFSWAFCSMELKPSLCSLPRLVIMPMVGLIIDCRLSISPTREMPASMMARSVLLSMSHNDRGTPIWLL